MSVTWGEFGCSCSRGGNAISCDCNDPAPAPITLEVREDEIPQRTFVEWVNETADYHLFLQQGHTVTA